MKKRITLPTFFDAEVRLVPVPEEPVDQTITAGNYGFVDSFIATNRGKFSTRRAGDWNMSLWPLDKKSSTEEVVRSIQLMTVNPDGEFYEGSPGIIQDLAAYKLAFPEDFKIGTTVLALGEQIDDCHVGCMAGEESNHDLMLVGNPTGEWKPRKNVFLVVWKKMARSQ